MVDKKPEMSLDEVLSSIKKMVIDSEPPVLELTDMVTSDGSIVKVKKDDSQVSNPDMSAFLKLIQESADTSSNEAKTKEAFIAKQLNKSPVITADVTSYPVSAIPKKEEVQKLEPKKDDSLSLLMKELATPLVQKWINENLPTVVSNIVESEVRKLINRV